MFCIIDSLKTFFVTLIMVYQIMNKKQYLNIIKK